MATIVGSSLKEGMCLFFCGILLQIIFMRGVNHLVTLA